MTTSSVTLFSLAFQLLGLKNGLADPSIPMCERKWACETRGTQFLRNRHTSQAEFSQKPMSDLAKARRDTRHSCVAFDAANVHEQRAQFRRSHAIPEGAIEHAPPSCAMAVQMHLISNVNYQDVLQDNRVWLSA